MPETAAVTSTEFGPRKTVVILAIVAGCFAILLPKIFYPMLTASLAPPAYHADSTGPIRQERQTPPHAGNYHPALRERGRAIPSSHIVPKIQDRPDHMTPSIKMRPPMGGAGHVVAAPKGNGFVGLLMPLYTIGIVIFFLYTLTKVLVGIFMPIYTIGNVVSFLYKVLQVLRKSSDSEILRPEPYSSANAEKEYQKIVFNPEIFAAAVSAVNGTQYEQNISSTTVEEEEEEEAPTIEELKEHQTSKSNGLAAGANPNSKDPNVSSEDQHDSELDGEICETTPTVKVVNMEMTATCEGGQRYSRPTTPTLLPPHSHQEEKEKSPPISIYLEGSLPAQCELLVTDSKTQELPEEETMEVPVVLSGKMTLSLISLDQESQDEHDTETPQYNYTDESNAEMKAYSSNNKIQVLKQENLDKEDNCESDIEEDEEEEEEEEEEESEEDVDYSLESNQKKKDQAIFNRSYAQHLSESFESDGESEDAANQNRVEKEFEKGTLIQNTETESEESEEEEDEEVEEDGEEEEDEEVEVEEDEEEIEGEEDGEEDGDEDDETEEDQEDEGGEEEEEDEDGVGYEENSETASLQSDSDDEHEGRNRVTELKKTLIIKKNN